MRVEKASRSYRRHFTPNYQALFPSQERLFRVDVLEAAVRSYTYICVNGEQFQFDDKVIMHSNSLTDAWQELMFVLKINQHRGTLPSVEDLTRILSRLDSLWAGFEDAYINELMAIEDKSRGYVISLVEVERQLRATGSRPVEESFVARINKLNSLANRNRKGRQDLGIDILDSAKEMQLNDDPIIRWIVADVMRTYANVRKYARKIGVCIDRLDPHLQNNSGLSKVLESWEESWERAKKYISDAETFRSFRALAGFLERCMKNPTFGENLEDYSADALLMMQKLVLFEAIRDKSIAKFLCSILPDAMANEFEEYSSKLDKSSIVNLESFDVVNKMNECQDDAFREISQWSFKMQRSDATAWNDLLAVLTKCLLPSDEVPERFMFKI
jgi:hypothetical protein